MTTAKKSARKTVKRTPKMVLKYHNIGGVIMIDEKEFNRLFAFLRKHFGVEFGNDK